MWRSALSWVRAPLQITLSFGRNLVIFVGLVHFIHITLQRRHNEPNGVSITSLTIVCSTFCSDTDQRKHQSSASLAFVRENSPHKWPVTRKMIWLGPLKRNRLKHDDVIKWKHFPRYWPFVRAIHRSPVNSPRKGQWRGALMFSLIYAWINGWVNNGEADDLRRHRTHYDVTVIFCTMHGSVTGMFCTKFQNDFAIQIAVIDGPVFNLRRILTIYLVTDPDLYNRWDGSGHHEQRKGHGVQQGQWRES